MVVTEGCIYSKNHLTVHSEWVECMFCEFYCNKADTNNKTVESRLSDNTSGALQAEISDVPQSPIFIYFLQPTTWCANTCKTHTCKAYKRGLWHDINAQCSVGTRGNPCCNYYPKQSWTFQFIVLNDSIQELGALLPWESHVPRTVCVFLDPSHAGKGIHLHMLKI